MAKDKKHSNYLWFSLITIVLLILISIIGPTLSNKVFSTSNLQMQIKTLKEIANSSSIIKKQIEDQIQLIEDSIKSNKTFVKQRLDIIRSQIEDIDSAEISQVIQQIEKKAIKWDNNSEIQNLNWFRTVFSWPFLILYLFMTLMYFRVSITDLLKNFGKVKSISIMGNGIDFTPDTKISSELAIKEYRSQINEIFSYQIQKEELTDKLRHLYEEVKKFLLDENKISDSENSRLRCTIHIQDILFEETLYQLLDYFPKGKIGGSGRIKSSRFGIIGLAWRTEKSQIRGNVSNTDSELIEKWGMDRNEAVSDSSIKSFAAILVKNGTNLAVIYFDSLMKDLFGDLNNGTLSKDAANFEKLVLDKAEQLKIIESLQKMKTELSNNFLRIRIYE